MKKTIILFCLVIFCLVSFGQVYQEMPQYGYRANRMVFDSTLSIPSVCGVPTLKSNLIKKAAIAFDSCNNRFYYYNPKTKVWSQVSGGSSFDTTYMSNRIDLKIDSLKRFSDSIYAYHNGVQVFQYTDSTFDSTSLSNRINLKVNISDTSTMLSNYLHSIDTTNKWIQSITRTAGKDSIIFYVGNSRYAIKDSVGTGGGGGGAAVSYYLNGGTAASVGTYYQMSNTAVVGTNADFSLAGNGLISQWLTDVGNPNQLQIAAGNWNFEMYMSASSNGGTPAFYVELLKYDGSTFTSIATSSAAPENIDGGTIINLYLTSLAIPQTTLLSTDRLAVRVYIVNSVGGRTITMHTQDSHLCQIITNFSSGISALNGLTSTTQTFSVDSSNSTFKITSSGTNHTFNIPNASASGVTRGLISNTQYTTFNNKVAFTDTSTTIATKSNLFNNYIFSVSTNTNAGSVTRSNYIYIVSGTTTITLPTAVGNTNIYTIKRVGTNTVSIATTSSQTIDGSASPIIINTRYSSITLVSDGTNWNII